MARKIRAKRRDEKNTGSVSRSGKQQTRLSKKCSESAVLQLQKKYGNTNLQRMYDSGALQAKLKIGKPGDRYEREADSVADRVMSMSEPEVSKQDDKEEEIRSKPFADQITPLVQKQPEEEEETAQAQFLRRQEEEEEVQKQSEEEEEPDQAKMLQPQAEEEETAQPKMLQRQAEEEEEPVQTKPLQRQQEEEEEEVQKQPEEEEEPVQAKFLQKQEEEEEPVQAKGSRESSPKISPSVESGINSLRGGGKPLSESSRAYFELRFGADFSGVRVHTDTRAVDLSKSINAKAFTLGNDVVFGSGQYSPQSSDGKKLLAHELTHTIQQDAHQRHLKYSTKKIKGSGKGCIQRKPTPDEKTEPTWALKVNKSHYQPYPGKFRWIYKGLFKAPDIGKRFYVVQWMKGSVQGCGKGGKGCYYAWKNNHLDKAKVKFNFPKWVVDAPSVKNAECVGLTKKGNVIGFFDAPGVAQSLEMAKKGRRWPTGTVWKADMQFRIQVYSKDSLKGTSVADFASIEDPKPVKTVKWSWKDSYTIP